MKTVFRALAAVAIVLALVSPAAATTITYTLNGAYSYTVKNDTLGATIFDFLIYFPDVVYAVPPGPLFTNILPTAVPMGWTGWGIEPTAPNLNGYAEFFGSFGLAPGGTLGGFKATFNYSGMGKPGSQYFEVYDQNYSLVDSGYTQFAGGGPVIPEPISLLLFGSGLAGIAVRRRRSR